VAWLAGEVLAARPPSDPIRREAIVVVAGDDAEARCG